MRDGMKWLPVLLFALCEACGSYDARDDGEVAAVSRAAAQRDVLSGWTDFTRSGSLNLESCVTCAHGGIDAMQCKGPYCSQIRIRCVDQAPIESTYTLNGISEEPPTNQAACNEGDVLTGLCLWGKNGDYLIPMCGRLSGYVSYPSGYVPQTFSEENGGTVYTHGSADMVTGLGCTGSYCDNVVMSEGLIFPL